MTRLGLILALLLTGLGPGNLGLVKAAAPTLDPGIAASSGITLLSADDRSITLAFDFNLDQLQIAPSQGQDALAAPAKR